ncbi:MAG TPA: hypothetical protein VFA59_07725 [Vicinamibacterales bacterium]|nr:hypothetical protein [Vicinamibacterales bacterium]
MIGRPAHPSDERLLESYYAERSGDAIDPRIGEHLTDCAACNGRYSELTRTLDEVRAEGIAEADAVFDADRLRAQRLAVARRLEHVSHPARVISFPARTGSAGRTPTTRIAPRWIAAAVAAGIVVGVALGASYQWESRTPKSEFQSSANSRLAPVATRGTGQADVAADDAFLSELDAALERPRTRALVAYDALTPHVRTVREQ